MAVINLDTGAIVTDAHRIAVDDVIARILWPISTRALFPLYGTTVWTYAQHPTQMAFFGLEASLRASLGQSTLYELVDVMVSQEGEAVLFNVTIRLPDGTIISVLPPTPVGYRQVLVDNKYLLVNDERLLID